MYLNACLTYEDVEARLLQENDGIHLLLYSKQMDLALSLNYSQIKVLADGCEAFLAKLPLREFAESSSNGLKGALQLECALSEAKEAPPIQNLQGFPHTA